MLIKKYDSIDKKITKMRTVIKVTIKN